MKLSDFWSKPSLDSENVRIFIYIVVGLPIILIGFILTILTLGWFSFDPLVKRLAEWAACGGEK